VWPAGSAAWLVVVGVSVLGEPSRPVADRRHLGPHLVTVLPEPVTGVAIGVRGVAHHFGLVGILGAGSEQIIDRVAVGVLAGVATTSSISSESGSIEVWVL
jgi:hypothetical protein